MFIPDNVSNYRMFISVNETMKKKKKKKGKKNLKYYKYGNVVVVLNERWLFNMLCLKHNLVGVSFCQYSRFGKKKEKNVIV